MQSLRDLYQDVIVDHNKHPRNFHEMADASCSAQGVNPICGDQLCVYLKVDNDVIIEASFLGKGCAICVASASLMTESMRGKTYTEAHQLFTAFHDLLTEENIDVNLDNLGKLAVFSGVREYPTRVKCATLAWHALQAALLHQSQPVSTENEPD